MRRLLALMAVAGTTLALLVAGGGTASALGGESLGCRVAPGTVFTFNHVCSNNQGASSYTVGFLVQNETGTSSYSWNVPTAYQSQIVGGCGSGQNWCTVSANNSDQEIYLTVTLTQGTDSETLDSYGFINQYCGSMPC